MANPYTPGAGTPPPVLTGRSVELARVERLLQRLQVGRPDRSIIISGLRGVGKTVLLREIELLAREADWATSEVLEIRPETNTRASLAKLSVTVLDDLGRVRAIAREARRRLLRVLGSFAGTLSVDGSLQIQVNMRPDRGIADSGDIESDLCDLFEELGDLALSSGTGVLFLIDEMQHFAPEALEALCAALHRVAQKRLPLAVVGAGLPQLPRLMTIAKSYAEREFAFIQIANLDDRAAREALIAPAHQLDVEFDGAAVDYIVSQTDGYPYFIQDYGSEVWDLAKTSPISIDDAHAAHESARRSLDEGFFSVASGGRNPLNVVACRRWRRLVGTARIRTLMSPAPFARTYAAVPEPNSTASLRRAWSIGPTERSVDFSVPQFADFLRRKHPF